MQGNKSANGLLDSDAAAAWLGISRRNLEMIVSRGELPRVRIGRLVRFKLADLERFSDARTERARF